MLSITEITKLKKQLNDKLKQYEVPRVPNEIKNLRKAK